MTFSAKNHASGIYHAGSYPQDGVHAFTLTADIEAEMGVDSKMLAHQGVTIANILYEHLPATTVETISARLKYRLEHDDFGKKA
jgi:hypothetical protein